jgi:uncharacterized FlaG/YvyC family protein
MSEYSIKSTKPVEQEAAGQLALAVAQKLTEMHAASKTQSVEKAATETKRANSNVNMSVLSNTSLRFMVDDKTQDVTVLIVDRKTDKVLMTIPAEAIEKIPAGELFQYSA